jgi:threonine dehydratase
MSSTRTPAGSGSDASYADVEAAAERLLGVAHRTPVMTSRTTDAGIGAAVFFKCENLQRMGAFKFRGAYNAMAKLPRTAAGRGVVTYSSGNHAQAVALAGQLLGIATVIVMPADAPRVKVDAVRGYGAEVVLYDRATQSRERLAADLAGQRGLHMVPPFDHVDVLAGQGTVAKELVEEVGPLDYLVVPCGGGGLLSGCAIAAHALSPGVRVYGVEPALGDDVMRSYYSGVLQSSDNPQTVADGARTQSAGKITFPLIRRHVQGMVAVDDRALLQAMKWMWERVKLVVEPTGALGIAALFEGKVDVRGKRVGVILSGGNADIPALVPLLD